MPTSIVRFTPGSRSAARTKVVDDVAHRDGLDAVAQPRVRRTGRRSVRWRSMSRRTPTPHRGPPPPAEQPSGTPDSKDLPHLDGGEVVGQPATRGVIEQDGQSRPTSAARALQSANRQASRRSRSISALAVHQVQQVVRHHPAAASASAKSRPDRSRRLRRPPVAPACASPPGCATGTRTVHPLFGEGGHGGSDVGCPRDGAGAIGHLSLGRRRVEVGRASPSTGVGCGAMDAATGHAPLGCGLTGGRMATKTSNNT